jgi:uncharacterized protein (DUF305 family)
MNRLFPTILTAAALSGAVMAQNTMPGMTMSHTNAAPMTPAQMGMNQMGMNMHDMTAATSKLSGLSGKAFDRAFLSMMIPHHTAAIAMSKAILPLSKDAQVKTWASDIIASQQAEIQAMNALLGPRGGPNTALKSLMDSGMNGKAMATVVKNARNPDQAFVQGMLPHHSGAIDMARLALTKSGDPQVLKLAKTIIVAQAGEMYDFQTWLSRR